MIMIMLPKNNTNILHYTQTNNSHHVLANFSRDDFSPFLSGFPTTPDVSRTLIITAAVRHSMTYPPNPDPSKLQVYQLDQTLVF